MASHMTEQHATPIELAAIGRIHTSFERLDQCPSSGRFNPDESVIELAPEFADGLLNIELASHIMILYWFDQADRAALSRRTEGNATARGVFASRSPNRPNPIALSIVKLLEHQGTQLRVSGLDCLNGTIVLDIKPYVPAEDRIGEARIGWDPDSTVKDKSNASKTGECRCQPRT